jgi:DNA adenine methylase
MPRTPAESPVPSPVDAFRSRVKGLAVLPVSRLVADPNNFRLHPGRQRDALRAVLRELGSVAAVLVRPAAAPALRSLRKVPRGDAEAFGRWLAAYKAGFVLVDGHLRADEAGPDGEVECLVLDLDAREAAEALATFDAVGGMAEIDREAFARNAALFSSTEPAIQALVADLARIRVAEEREASEILETERAAGERDEAERRIVDDPSLDEGERGETPDDGSEEPSGIDVHDLRAPFPWFGGKSRASGIVWGALGNVPNYVEPFFGSGAVLLARPGGPGKIETVNDLDRWVANFWRAVSIDPDAVARHADSPVNEADVHAWHKSLLSREEWKAKMQDGNAPDYFDAEIAGRWVWGLCAWIGSGWCAPKGAEPSAQVPRLSGSGQGIHGARVSEKIPMLAHGAHGARGVHSIGISEQLPHLGGREMDYGRGVHSRTVSANIAPIMRELRDRLRRVRVACGDWERVLTPAVTTGHGLTGVFLDPPYAEGAGDLYGNHDKSVSARVRAWAIEHGNDPLLRIAFCGYAGEHEDFPPGWRKVAWKARGGYGSGNGNPHRERIWLSPGCLKPGDKPGFPVPTDDKTDEPARHPLAIVLSNAEKRRWDARKAELGTRDDRSTLVSLLGAVS